MNNPCHFSSLLQPFPNPSTHRAFLSAGSAAADCNGTHAGQHQQLSYHTSDQLSRCQQLKTQSNVSFIVSKRFLPGLLPPPMPALTLCQHGLSRAHLEPPSARLVVARDGPSAAAFRRQGSRPALAQTV